MLSIRRVSRVQVGYYTRQSPAVMVSALPGTTSEQEAPGRRAGRGAAAVGLTGELAEGQLEALLEGRHPESGE